jgi:hypothetical protein
MTVVEYYWEGKGPLWKVYWIYGVLLSVVLAAIVAAAGLRHWVSLPALIAMVVGLAIYTGWILVSVWRCADNIEGRPLGLEPDVWSSLARALTVGWAINVLALSILLIQMTVAGWW